MFYNAGPKSRKIRYIFPVEDPNEMAFYPWTGCQRLKEKRIQTIGSKRFLMKHPMPKILPKPSPLLRKASKPQTPFDNYMNDQTTFHDEANHHQRKAVFMNKRPSVWLSFSPDFTGDEFRNIGLFDKRQFLDKGRFDVTKDSADLGKFKVPRSQKCSSHATSIHAQRNV